MTWSLIKEKKRLEVHEQEVFECLDPEEGDYNNNEISQEQRGLF